MKIAYHCFSCKNDIIDIEAAESHSKSFDHDVTETICGEDSDGESLLI
ncbi:MAG TPA: hypothetical protein VIX38_03185 [Nitrososphaeraceae archaeon]